MKALTLGTFVILAIALSALLDDETGVAIWRELRRDLGTANARVEQLARENDALRSEIALLEGEPAAVDRAIREELDLVRPGEIVVRFEPTGIPAGDPGSEASGASLAPAEAERRWRGGAEAGAGAGVAPGAESGEAK